VTPAAKKFRFFWVVYMPEEETCFCKSGRRWFVRPLLGCLAGMRHENREIRDATLMLEWRRKEAVRCFLVIGNVEQF
jgi:hypothetical protein